VVDVTADVDLTQSPRETRTLPEHLHSTIACHANFSFCERDPRAFTLTPEGSRVLQNIQASARPLHADDVAALLRKALHVHSSVPEAARRSHAWWQQHRPLRLADYVKHYSSENEVAEFQRWLQDWKRALAPHGNSPGTRRWDGSQSSDDEAEQLSNVYFVCGPVGCGKTSFVSAVAKDHGFEVIEVSSAQQRGGAVLTKLLKEATQSKSVQMQSNLGGPFKRMKKSSGKSTVKKGRSKTPAKKQAMKQNLIFFDEVDVTFSDDVGFYAFLRSLASTARCPIVMTCNCIPEELRSMWPAKYLHLPPLLPEQVVAWCQSVALTHGALLSNTSARQLVTQRGCDIRAILTQLQFWIGITPYVLPSQTDENVAVPGTCLSEPCCKTLQSSPPAVDNGDELTPPSNLDSLIYITKNNDTVKAISKTHGVPAKDLIAINRPHLGKLSGTSRFHANTKIYLAEEAAAYERQAEQSFQQLRPNLPDSFALAQECVQALCDRTQSVEFQLCEFLSNTRWSGSPDDNIDRTQSAVRTKASIEDIVPFRVKCEEDCSTRLSVVGKFPRPLPLRSGVEADGATPGENGGEWGLSSNLDDYDVYALFHGGFHGRVRQLTPTHMVIDVWLPDSVRTHRNICPVNIVINGVPSETYFGLFTQCATSKRVTGVVPSTDDSVNAQLLLEEAERTFEHDDIEDTSDDFEDSPVAKKRVRRSRRLESESSDEADEARCQEDETESSTATGSIKPVNAEGMCSEGDEQQPAKQTHSSEGDEQQPAKQAHPQSNDEHAHGDATCANAPKVAPTPQATTAVTSAAEPAYGDGDSEVTQWTLPPARQIDSRPRATGGCEAVNELAVYADVAETCSFLGALQSQDDNEYMTTDGGTVFAQHRHYCSQSLAHDVTSLQLSSAQRGIETETPSSIIEQQVGESAFTYRQFQMRRVSHRQNAMSLYNALYAYGRVGNEIVKRQSRSHSKFALPSTTAGRVIDTIGFASRIAKSSAKTVATGGRRRSGRRQRSYLEIAGIDLTQEQTQLLHSELESNHIDGLQLW